MTAPAGPASDGQERRRPVRRTLLTVAGAASLALGVVGLFVPILPTTPFLLLAAACWLRGSRRLYRWLVGHRFLGPRIEDYLSRRVVPRRARNFALVSLWLSLGVSALLVDAWSVRAVLAVVGLAVSIHIASLKTDPKTAGGPTAGERIPAKEEA